MPYSPNSDDNKRNPLTPSDATLTNQLLYKIAALDSAVNQGFRRLDEKMERFQTDLHENQINTNDRINAVEMEFHQAINFKRQRIDGVLEKIEQHRIANDKRFNEIETWQKIVMARIGIAVIAVVIFWTIFGPYIRHALGIDNG